MKKIILYSILLLAFVACNKSKDDPQPDVNESYEIQQLNEETAGIIETEIKKIPQDLKGNKLTNTPEIVGYWLYTGSGGGITGEYTDALPHTYLLIDSFGRFVYIFKGSANGLGVIELNDTNVLITEDKGIYYGAIITNIDSLGTVISIGSNSISFYSFPTYEYMRIGSNWSQSYEKLAIDSFEYLLSID